MSKRVRIALAIAFVALAGAVVWLVAQPRAPEPVYEGKRLSVWLTSESGEGESGETVRQIGTNGIPTLLRLLRVSDSALKRKLMELLERQDLIKIEYTPADNWHYRAAYAFGVLGTNGHAAVPALMKIADDNISPSSRACAIESLGYVALPTKEAVSALMRWATNADRDVRNWAGVGLLRIDPEAAARAGVK